MKGMVFTMLEDMVVQQLGMDTWEKVLDRTELDSQGVYTSVATYPDEEFLALVKAVSEVGQIPIEKLIQEFGVFMFPSLAKKFPIFVGHEMTLKEFLKSIESVIHVEVRKLYPEAGLPTFKYEEPSENQLVMIYSSPRKLCFLAIGLIHGAAHHFQTPIQIRQTNCMHHNDEHCRLEVEFLPH
jgi:hypothetical protein